ncbi:MAG: transcriptional regulator [Candidatus Lambdaproteobacteria bacterium]|nr:transcriptional regulator [Candidatus Lambdaproteobacteria bacterium]
MSEAASKKSGKTFPQRLRDAREAGNQTTEVMAVLLNLPHEAYQQLEAGSYPDDQTLRRICVLLGWNYYETQRQLINEMIAPRRSGHHGEGSAATRSADGHAPHVHPHAALHPHPVRADTLGSRLRDVRLVTGQAEDVIAMLLNIDVDTYRALENGKAPSDGLLRRISTVYHWNYQDLLSILRTEHAQRFQPLHLGVPFPSATASQTRLHEITQDIHAFFGDLRHSEQERICSQLEFIRDTMRKDADRG